MFDSFLNVIIVIIALTVFIGRSVLQVKARKKAAGQQQRAPAPVKDDEDEEPYRDLAYYIELEEKKAKEAAAKKKAIPKKAPVTGRLVKESYVPEPVIPKTPPAPAKVPFVSVQEPGILNLRHLSSLKQAVVMAEVLGIPKGLQ